MDTDMDTDLDTKSQLSIASHKSSESETGSGTGSVTGDVTKGIQQAVKAVVAEVATTVVAETVKNVTKVIHVQEKFPQPSRRLQRIAQPSMTSYMSLYNNHRNVLRPEKIRQIEEKMADIRKYSRIIADDLKVLIVDKINGIDQKQAKKLQMIIMESLENFAPTTAEVPKFLETSYDFKCIKIVCADTFTVDWLKGIIAHLSPPPWNKAQLEVISMSSYSDPSTKSKKPYKLKPKVAQVKFYIAAPKKKPEFEEVIKRIEMSNQPIKTDTWIKLKEEDTKKGNILYYVSMSKQSLDEIRNKNFSLFYLLGTIKIVPLSENEEIVVTTNNAPPPMSKLLATAGSPPNDPRLHIRNDKKKGLETSIPQSQLVKNDSKIGLRQQADSSSTPPAAGSPPNDPRLHIRNDKKKGLETSIPQSQLVKNDSKKGLRQQADSSSTPPAAGSPPNDPRLHIRNDKKKGLETSIPQSQLVKNDSKKGSRQQGDSSSTPPAVPGQFTKTN